MHFFFTVMLTFLPPSRATGAQVKRELQYTQPRVPASTIVDTIVYRRHEGRRSLAPEQQYAVTVYFHNHNREIIKNQLAN